MWSIRVLSGSQTGQIFDLKLGKNVFGRSLNCDVKIQSVGISKEHCEIHVYKDKMMVVDLKSSNGTFVNGVKIQNSIIHLGDKISLFDVIMDVIPAPDIRPKSIAVTKAPPRPIRPIRVQAPPPPSEPQYSTQDQFQQQVLSETELIPQQPQSLSDKIETYIENTMMPAIYKLAILIPFKHILIGFILVFIIGVTLLSLIPLTTVTRESNFNEAGKRAKSVARALARVNELALLSGQFGSLNVADALKEDGIKEALIIQQSDGAIVAPPEKAGREASKPFITEARKESKSTVGVIDSNTIGATHPIGIYDPNTGESMIKYHAIVYYDISSLGVDEGRVISLFMQTLVIASILGFFIYFIFARLIQYPLNALNKQIDQALREKTDRTEVPFDYPEFQKVVANVNLILNRMWNGLGEEANAPLKQNRDLEFMNLVEILTQPAVVISGQGLLVAVNEQFEQLSQMNKESLVQNHFSMITDQALSQNIEALIIKAKESPYEKHTDIIPFSQFECAISILTSLGPSGEPEYYFLTLARIEQG